MEIEGKREETGRMLGDGGEKQRGKEGRVERRIRGRVIWKRGGGERERRKRRKNAEKEKGI